LTRFVHVAGNTRFLIFDATSGNLIGFTLCRH
jgi:hypothetical protein